MIAKFDGKCRRCGTGFRAGDSIRYSNLTKQTFCIGCWGSKSPDPRPLVQPEPTEATPALARLVEAVERNGAAHAAALSGQETAPESTMHPETVVTLTGATKGTPEGHDAYLAPLAAALARHMALPAVSVDPDMVETIAARVVSDAIAKLEAPAPTVVEIRRPDAPPVTIEHAHYLMPRLLRLMGAGIHVYLWGPAGTGKTTAALQAAHALRGLDGGEIDTLDQSTPKSAIMGYRNLDKTPAETAFSRCWERGRIYIADETDNSPANVQTIFNSALANGHAPLAWGSVARGEGFGFVGTGNTPGRPTPAFPDRRPMSAAFADRLYFIHWPLDGAIECRAGGLAAPSAPKRVETTCTPGEWVTWVRSVREWAARNAPTLMVTPRASILGVQALALGETPAEVADGLVFRGADAALVSKTLAAVALPGA